MTLHLEARKKHLEEDVLTLHELMSRADALPPRHVRAIAVPIVRKWVSDGNINTLAHELGAKLELKTQDASSQIDELAMRPEVLFFMTGGVLIGGCPVTSVYYSTEPYQGAPPFHLAHSLTLMSPGRYMKSKRLYFKGKSYTVAQLIEYASNKFGGVHYDPARSKNVDAELERVSAFFSFAAPSEGTAGGTIDVISDPELRVVVRLKGLTYDPWSCLDAELLSMAQALINVHCDGSPLFIFGE